MDKKKIVANNAPGAIGPYSQGIINGNMVFVSGQLPIDVASGGFPDGIKAQTQQSIKNVKAILESVGSSLDKVVKTTVLLSDMENFGAMNEVYSQFFKDPYPARSCFEVGRLPKDALVEVEVIASL
jgi:2-iminobutanoate/2-iminopropanoate deaminase